ncbi:chromate transporter [Erysipelothrix rhusiopathiae]|uniref:chromate transporter n=1 Tax=Erysipelothrix rhusiopathiae TaxID=1648 RepID=UPI002B253D08|nr:chromate transporter [Erysipelothrix rhusiopathiae]WRB93065.1 chromate transporter [Erysipelothrix rhusiopathiae]
MILWELFISFMQIGLVSFGGGYAALAPIQSQVVVGHGWLTMTEFTDLITISQMTPGPIALNAATFVGLRVAGIPGAVAATLGNVFPSIVIVLFLATIYYKFSDVTIIQNVLDGLRPTVVTLIASAGLTILITAFFGEGAIDFSQFDVSNGFLFVIAIIGLRKFKLDPTKIIILTGLLGICAMVLEKL